MKELAVSLIPDAQCMSPSPKTTCTPPSSVDPASTGQNINGFSAIANVDSEEYMLWSGTKIPVSPPMSREDFLAFVKKVIADGAKVRPPPVHCVSFTEYNRMMKDF